MHRHFRNFFLDEQECRNRWLSCQSKKHPADARHRISNLRIRTAVNVPVLIVQLFALAAEDAE